jgi:hypothetical protein
MRILPFLAPEKGFEPRDPELNLDEGVLDIFHPSECVLMEESKIAAETLVLRCTLRPIPLNDKNIKVQVIVEGEALEDSLLYAEESIAYGFEREVENAQWRGIAVDYTGIGRGVHQGESFVFHGKTLPSGEIEAEKTLYTKPFRNEEFNHQERMTTLASGHLLTSPPGVLDTQVLRGYGGYYKEGIPLADMEQIYYGLTSTHNQTRVRLFSSSTLQERNTPPPYEGKHLNTNVLFSPPPRPEEYLSLPGTLAAGYARFSVLTDVGRIPFSSFLCEPVPGHPSFVNVYFRYFK